MGKIGINILSRKWADFRMVIRYIMIVELSNEETTNERSANNVCIFTNELDGLQEMSGKGEKASIQDCKGS